MIILLSYTTWAQPAHDQSEELGSPAVEVAVAPTSDSIASASSRALIGIDFQLNFFRETGRKRLELFQVTNLTVMKLCHDNTYD